MLWIGFVFLLVGESLAQIPFLGCCPNLQPVSNFDASKILGRWYEQASVTKSKYGCVTVDFLAGPNDTMKIYKQLQSGDDVIVIIDGLVILTEDPHLGIYYVEDPELHFDVDLPYVVLNTDYKHWALVANCVDFPLFNVLSAWIVTREQHPSAEILEEAFECADSNNISRELFLEMDTETCPA